MEALRFILTSPVVLAGLSLLAAAFVVAILRIPKAERSRRAAIRVLAGFCIALIGSWNLWLKSQVVDGSAVPTPMHPIAVALGSTTTYVSAQLADQYKFGMVIFFALLIGFIFAWRIAGIRNAA